MTAEDQRLKRGRTGGATAGPAASPAGASEPPRRATPLEHWTLAAIYCLLGSVVPMFIPCAWGLILDAASLSAVLAQAISSAVAAVASVAGLYFLPRRTGTGIAVRSLIFVPAGALSAAALAGAGLALVNALAPGQVRYSYSLTYVLTALGAGGLIGAVATAFCRRAQPEQVAAFCLKTLVTVGCTVFLCGLVPFTITFTCERNLGTGFHLLGTSMFVAICASGGLLWSAAVGIAALALERGRK